MILGYIQVLLSDMAKVLDNKDLGILIFRIGVGIAFILHGFPKLVGGEEVWIKVGSAVSYLGIHSFHKYWGLLAALTEVLGGLFLVTGMFFRFALVGLLGTMVVATVMKISQGKTFVEYSHSLELAIVLLAFIFIGVGKYKITIGVKK